MKPFVVGLIYSVLMVHLYYATGGFRMFYSSDLPGKIILYTKEVVCGFPGTPAYGYVKPDLEAYEDGDVVSYSCRVGYILLGSPISRCTEDGSWTEDVPICDDSMTTLGVAFSTPTVPGHAAEMAIDRDKETCSYLKPKKPRWWRIDLGNVHKVLSVAVTMISPDKNVKFTIFVIKTLESNASYKRCASFSGRFGTQTIVLSCAEGKGIVGEKVHIEDHLQTEGLFEICEVEVQVEKDTGYECGRPSRNLYSITYAPRGKRVDYGCIRGYEIKGRDFRKCYNSGQWSDEPPVCEPIICDDLDPLDNGFAKLSHENGPPLEGTIAIYKCNEGFKLIGTFTRNCLKDGSWSDKAPQCKAIRCNVPDGKDVGGVYRLINQTNSMGSMAKLRCKRGKTEGNNPYITCTEDGTWTEPEAHCIIPAGAAYESKEEEPRIAKQGVIIFGMIVAAVMIVVVLVSLYLYTQKRRNGDKPVLPSRLAEPPAPPPRPPKGGAFKSALMGLISRDSIDKPEDQKELQNSWHGVPPDSGFSDGQKGGQDDPAVIEVEVLAQDDFKRKGVYPVPEENENASLENVVLDMDKGSDKGASPKEQRSTASDYASVDYDKKRQSRLLKDQDSIDSTSTTAASPLPPDESEKKVASHSPTPTKPTSESEEESEEEEDESEEKKKEEEERKAKEEEERKAKEEEERKAKEEAEKKEKEAAAAPGRRRRGREEPPPAVDEKPVLRRVRRL